jgi:pyruvate dehydrogenase E1 component
MWRDDEDVIYYLTLYNENHPMPPMPEGSEDGILEGLYRWAPAPEGPKHPASILFSGTANLAAREAQSELAEHYDVAADLHSATSYKRLREQALTTERWNRLHADQPAQTPRVTELLQGEGPVVAVTDFMKAVPDQIARWVPQDRGFVPLGTDGFGRSDTREALRRYFEVDAPHVVVATLAGLAERGDVKPEAVTDAIARYGLDPEAPEPRILA